MDNCVFLLILIIIIAGIIVFYITESPIPYGVVGGSGFLMFANGGNDLPHFNKDKQLFIGNDVKIVVDGHNMIHRVSHNNMCTMEFEETLKDISEMLMDAFPTQDLHIVLKNPKDSIIKAFDKMKEQERQETQTDKPRIPNRPNQPLKKSSEERISYFRELVTLSMLYPRITYHLAYGKEPVAKSSKSHHMKSRDDFLTIYLARNGYMLSQDRFRDFNQFSNIKPFKHYSVNNGVVQPKEIITPSAQWSQLESPNLGNHLIFEIVEKNILKKHNITNGSVYLGNNSAFGCAYIADIEEPT
jgi:hypothetical protein